MYIDNPELQKKKAEATKEKREKIVFGDKPYRCQKCGILKDPKDFVIHWLDSYWVGKYRYLYECKQCKKDRIYQKRSSQRETIDTALDIIYKQLKQGAKKRQIPFEISISDLQNLREKQGGNCYYSGYTMTFEYIGNKEGDISEKTKYQVSCDRINNAIGYIPGNIVLCCTIVNKMKNTSSQKEFYQICKDISTKHK